MFKPIKELGQNFLIDSEVVLSMIQALDITEGDEVIEIGPGLGALTIEISKQLLTQESKLIAVEIDPRFVDKLRAMFLENYNTRIIEQDILEFLPAYTTLANFKIIGSLPYYITSPILHSIIYMQQYPEISVLLVQKEVSDRIANNPPDATYISTMIQTFFKVEKIMDVDKSKFSPEPKVDGGIIKLTKKETQLISKDQIRRYEGFLHKGFSKPRKMLNKAFSKQELERINFDASLRPQNISVEQWTAAFKTLV